MTSDRTAVKIDLLVKILLTSAILLLPFQLYFDVVGTLSITAVAVIIGLASLLIVFLWTGVTGFFLQGDRIDSSLLFFLLSMVLSTIVADNPIISLKYMIKWIAFMLIYFAVRTIIKRGVPVYEIIGALVLGTAISSLMAIIFFFTGEKTVEAFLASPAAQLFIDPATLRFGEINWFRGGGTGGTFFNRNWFAAFLGFVLPICMLRAALVQKRRYLWTAASLVLLGGLIVTLSRGGWLGMTVAIIVIVMVVLRRSWKVVTVTLGGIILFLGLIAIVSPAIWSMLVERVATSLVVDYKVNRILIWTDSLNAFAQKPMFGIGVANNPIGSAHSIYLQIAVEQGLVGLSIFLFILTTVFQRLFATIRFHEHPREIALGLGLLGCWSWFCVHGLLETIMFNEKVLSAFALILGVTVSWLEREEHQPPETQ